jgi:hypothetical protein
LNSGGNEEFVLEIGLEELESGTKVLFKKDGNALIGCLLGGNDVKMGEVRWMGAPPGFRNRGDVNAVVAKEFVKVNYFIWGVQTPDVDGGEGNRVI